MITDFLAGLAILFTLLTGGEAPQPETFGAFGDPFLSIQVGTSPTSGDCLQTDGTNSTWDPCPSGGGGGGGGAGTWSTTTSQVSGTLINFPNNTSDVVAIGSNASTTAEFWFDPNTTSAWFEGGATTTLSFNSIAVNPTYRTGIKFFEGDSGTMSLLYDGSGSGSANKLSIWDDTAGAVFERFVFQRGGNFGIATSSPYAALSVVGEAVARNFTSTTTIANTFPNASTTQLSVGSLLYFDSDQFDSLTDDATLDNNGGDLRVVDVTCTDCLSTTETDSTIAISARNLTVAGTANQITSSAGAQDLSADRTWTLSFPNLVIFPGNASSTLFSSTYASSTNQVIGGNLTFGGVTGTAWSAFCTAITGGAGLCDGTDDGGVGGGLSSYDAWTHPQAGTSATTSGMIFSAASSTFTGGLSILNATATNATSTTLNVSGQVDFDTLTSAILLTGTGGILAEYAGTDCTSQVVEDLSALGAASCVSINNTYWSGTDLSVANGGTGLSTFGGTNTILYTTVADTLSSEAAFTYDPSANRLTAENATTTNISASQSLYAGINGSAHQIQKFGEVSWSYGSTTQGQGTTTRPVIKVMPAAGSFYETICHSNSFMRVLAQDEAGNRMNDLIASSTEGTVTLSTNNSFTAGEVIYFYVGTTTNIASNVYAGCTFKYRYN